MMIEIATRTIQTNFYWKQIITIVDIVVDGRNRWRHHRGAMATLDMFCDADNLGDEHVGHIMNLLMPEMLYIMEEHQVRL